MQQPRSRYGEVESFLAKVDILRWIKIEESVEEQYAGYNIP